MFNLPKLPGWDGLHPLVVHFPIALLFVVPILLIIGLIWKNKAKCYLIAALIIMFLGTISAFVAGMTGDAAGEIAQRTPQITAMIEKHDDMAETTRTVFTILTIIYATLLFLPKLLKKEIKPNLFLILNIIFLILYGLGMLILTNTGHLGARLVHELGVKGLM
jgi:uncharacterized membrane protein